MTNATQEQMLNRVMENVAAQVSDSIKNAVVEAVEKALSGAMNNALVENEFYKRLNDEMRQGLQSIYKEITVAAAPTDEEQKRDKASTSASTGKLFSEASQQIEEVMNTTLEATESIMGAVEGLLDRQQEMAMLLVALQDEVPEIAVKLEEHVTALDADLTGILTACSFQDLTGQRLKKVVKALSDIQESIFDMYVSSGIMLMTREEMPEKDLEEITRESRKKFEEIKGSELKGPSSHASQSDVDSLLADLGL